MDSYMDIANGPGMWIACSIIIIVVFIQAIRFMIISYRTGRAIGMSHGALVQAFRTGVISALVPSIAVLVGVAVLAAKLGAPFPWMRLSVIGSVIYELFAVEIAATAMGLPDSTSGFTGDVFALAVWTMSMGFIFCLIFVALFTPRLKKIKDRLSSGDDGWMRVMNSAAFFGAFGVLWGQPVARGGYPLAGFISGGVTMIAIQLLIRHANQAWLKEWALSVSIIAGMAVVGYMHAHGMGG